MKLIKTLFIVIALLVTLSCKQNNPEQSLGNLLEDLVKPTIIHKPEPKAVISDAAGISSSDKGVEASEAITYAYGSNGGYVLKDDADYKTPQIVTKLGNYKMVLNGKKEVAEENPSVSTYYDGSAKLNNIQITCRIYTDKNDCLHRSACGWCAQSHKCISGSSSGPLEPCLASTYKFSVPSLVGAFDPRASLAAENFIGTTINLRPENR